MSYSERKYKASVFMIWSEAMLDGEPVRVSSVNGINRIIIGGFDTHVPGCYGGDAKKIIEAYQMQIEETEKAFARMLDEPDDPSSCAGNCGLSGLSEAELDQQIAELDELIQEYEKDRGQVIDLRTGELV